MALRCPWMQLLAQFHFAGLFKIEIPHQIKSDFKGSTHFQFFLLVLILP